MKYWGQGRRLKIAIAAGDERIYERLSGYMRKLLGGSAALRDIIYADFQDRKVTLHFKNGINQTVRATLAEIEALLYA